MKGRETLAVMSAVVLRTVNKLLVKDFFFSKEVQNCAFVLSKNSFYVDFTTAKQILFVKKSASFFDYLLKVSISYSYLLVD